MTLLRKKYGIMIIPARIIGRRWAFVGGATDVPLGLAHRIELDNGTGVIVYNWNHLSQDQKKKAEIEIREIILPG